MRRVPVAICSFLILPLVTSCADLGQSGRTNSELEETSEAPVPPQAAEDACTEFEQSLHSWQEGFTRATLALDDSEYVSAQELMDLAETLASDLPPGQFQNAFTLTLGEPGNNDTPNVEGIDELVEACGSHDAPIVTIEFSAEDRQELRAEKAREREVASWSNPPAPPSEGDALKQQALNEMWATTGASEKAATCELYKLSPDSIIDGFMSEVGDAFSRSMVRDFYDSRCPSR